MKTKKSTEVRVGSSNCLYTNWETIGMMERDVASGTTSMWIGVDVVEQWHRYM